MSAAPHSAASRVASLFHLHAALGRAGDSGAAARAGTAALHPVEVAATTRSPLQVDQRYGRSLDVLYRCLLLQEGQGREGRERLLLHRAHVASYRAAGLLGAPQLRKHTDTGSSTAVAAAESAEGAVQRLTVRVVAASSTRLSDARASRDSAESVDTAVFSTSDWSDDDDNDDDSDEDAKLSSHLHQTHVEQLTEWLRPSSATAHHRHAQHDPDGHHQQPHSHGSHDPVHSQPSHEVVLLLLQSLLLLYVDVFTEQPDAFAPFTKRGHGLSEQAALLYEHLMQKAHGASAFHSLARNLRWHSVKTHLLHFFQQELGDGHQMATTAPTTGASSAGSASQPRQPPLAAAEPSAGRLHSALSSMYHRAAEKIPHAAPFTSGAAPFAPSTAPAAAAASAARRRPAGAAAVAAVIGPSADYLRLLNVACSELHALYMVASSKVSEVLESQVLSPAAFERFDRAEDINHAVLQALRSATVTEPISAYHVAYERAVLTFPGYVLLSRSLRHRVESDVAFMLPITFTDLIVAVHGISSLLIAAFQQLVVSTAAAAVELLTNTERLRAVRSAQHTLVSHEQEVESVSAWLYDSRVYPKALSDETFHLLALVQVGDAMVLREVAAERFDEAVERLRALSQLDKAELLGSLAQQRRQQREKQMAHDIASASRASHLGLSTASLSLRDRTSDSVSIELLRNDSDDHVQATNSHYTSKSALEPNSPNPTAARQRAPQLQPKQRDSGKKDKSVQLDDILKWLDISPQYVVGLGRDDDWAELRAFAVYDKSFSEPKFDSIKDILVTGLTTRKQIHSHQLHKTATHSSKSMVDFVEAVLFSAATSSEAVHAGPDFFADPLLMWKEGRKPFDVMAIRQPVAFNDIDWLQMFVDSQALAGVLHSLSDVSSLVDSDSDVLRPLANAHFLPQVDASGCLTGFLLPLHRARTARPVKVVDLRYPNSSFAHSAARATYTNAIKGALSDSPIYGPTQAVNAALERIFDFTDLLYLEKQAQALLLVAEAIDGHPRSPFAHSVFTRADLDSAIFYLLRSNIMLSAVFVNLFTNNIKLAGNYLAHIDAKREHSLEQLRKRRGLTVLPLSHSFFALTILYDPHTGALTRLKLFVLGFTKLGRSAKPHCAVDFLRPSRETTKRLALQYLLTGANFLYIPFPGANGLPKIIYKELVVREQNRRQMWEAGLLAHIQHYPHELTDLFVTHLHVSTQAAALLEEQAVLILQDRQLSPLDFDLVEREQHRGVVETWLEHQDHAYTRIQPKLTALTSLKAGVLLDAKQMLKLATTQPDQ